MKLITPLFVTLAVMHVASAATLTNYSTTQLAGSSYTNYNIAQFDSSLGELTGVEVAITTSTLEGSVVLHSSGFAGPPNYSSGLDVQEANSGLGYSLDTGTISNVNYTPSFAQFNGLKTITIAAGQNFSLSPEFISSSYFGAYESVGGTGSVTFQIKNTQTITGPGIASADTSAAGANSQVAVTYTYTPAPEPSAALLGGLGLLGLVRRRR